jgi:hypothetical protein
MAMTTLRNFADLMNRRLRAWLNSGTKDERLEWRDSVRMAATYPTVALRANLP